VIAHLAEAGWRVERFAKTDPPTSGEDIVAVKDGIVRIVEVKGWPSSVYERGAKKGQSKSTRPETQARHWFGDALLTALLRRDRSPDAEIFLAFPSMATYERLLMRTASALGNLEIGVYIVSSDGEVRKHRR
jgi:hypothetical protein